MTLKSLYMNSIGINLKVLDTAINSRWTRRRPFTLNWNVFFLHIFWSSSRRNGIFSRRMRNSFDYIIRYKTINSRHNTHEIMICCEQIIILIKFNAQLIQSHSDFIARCSCLFFCSFSCMQLNFWVKRRYHYKLE